MLCLQNIQGGIQAYGGVQHINKAVLHTTQRKHALSSKHTGGIQACGGCHNIWVFQHIDASKHMGVSKHTGWHPNIWGVQTYRGHPNI